MPNPQDIVNVVMPNLLRDRVARLRLHPRQPLYEVLEEALDVFEAHGAWLPHLPAPIDPYPPGAWCRAGDRSAEGAVPTDRGLQEGLPA